MIYSLLDEIAPPMLAAISGDQGDVLAVGCVVLPYGDLFSRHVAFDRYASRRISGSSEPNAIDWYPGSPEEVAAPEARVAAVKGRIEELFIDGGYRSAWEPREFGEELRRREVTADLPVGGIAQPTLERLLVAHLNDLLQRRGGYCSSAVRVASTAASVDRYPRSRERSDRRTPRDPATRSGVGGSASAAVALAGPGLARDSWFGDGSADWDGDVALH